MTSTPRVVFAGTPDFAVPALSALIGAGWDVATVYTQPDRPAGRGRKTVPGPIKQVALSAGIEVLQPSSLKGPAALEHLRSLGADIMIVAAYGLLLPAQILAAPRSGCINIHASVLPRWRGAAPIQRAIEAGDESTGASIMRMEAGLDTGPVYASRAVRIGRRESAGELHDRLAALGAKLLLDTLPGILAGEIEPEPQKAEEATYARKLAKSDARIDWRQSTAVIDRLIRAFDPWPVAETLLDGARLRLWQAEPLEPPVAGDVSTGSTSTAPQARPGQVITTGPQGIDVATGDGILRLTRVQAPGKQPVAAADFANARRITGVMLG